MQCVPATRARSSVPGRVFLAPLLALSLVGCQAPATDPVSPDGAATSARLRAVPFVDVHFTDTFWAPRLQTNLTVTIPHIMAQNETTGRVDNLRKGAGLIEGRYEGRRFNDTDVYKIIEAASYAIAHEYDTELDQQLDALIEIIAAAQEDDGYLMPARHIDPAVPAAGMGSERWIHVSNGSHELYNAGHLIEAAVAHYQATGKRSLLEVAIRFADLIDHDFGPGKRQDIPGHEEIELALVKLADVTGELRYVELARFFIDGRGTPHDGDDYPEGDSFVIYNDLPYKQDHLPVIEQSTASGHAVRAMYLYTGMADVAARVPAPGYEAALDNIWDDVVSTKMYLTGGVGSRGTFESFGEDYELPNRTAYAETCAAVGHDLWNHRMFLATGDVRYLDMMERILYNGFLSGVALAGDEFFYTNPLESAGEVQRSEYFDVSCCPANLARLMALLPGFIYAQRGNELYVNLYVGNEATIELQDGAVRLSQQTNYPWSGTIRLEILEVGSSLGEKLELNLRIPGWARGEVVASDLYRYAGGDTEAIRVAVNGMDVPVESLDTGLLHLARSWQAGDVIEIDLPMPVRVVRGHDGIEANRGKVALQRGPLVYAAEAIDNDGAVLDLEIDAAGPFDSGYEADLLGGVTVLSAPAWRGDRAVTLRAVPYFAWANRGPGEMAVWIPVRGE